MSRYTQQPDYEAVVVDLNKISCSSLAPGTNIQIDKGTIFAKKKNSNGHVFHYSGGFGKDTDVSKLEFAGVSTKKFDLNQKGQTKAPLQVCGRVEIPIKSRLNDLKLGDVVYLGILERKDAINSKNIGSFTLVAKSRETLINQMLFEIIDKKKNPKDQGNLNSSQKKLDDVVSLSKEVESISNDDTNKKSKIESNKNDTKERRKNTSIPNQTNEPNTNTSFTQTEDINFIDDQDQDVDEDTENNEKKTKKSEHNGGSKENNKIDENKKKRKSTEGKNHDGLMNGLKQFANVYKNNKKNDPKKVITEEKDLNDVIMSYAMIAYILKTYEHLKSVSEQSKIGTITAVGLNSVTVDLDSK